MESRGDKIITFVAIELLVVALVLLLLVGVLLVTSYSPVQPSGKVVIIDLSNANYIENTCKIVKVPYKVKVPYEVSRWEEFSDLDYKSRVYEKRTIGYLGNAIDEYVVYIDNRGHDDEYFEVKFIFRDYYGKEHTYLVAKYVEAGESEKFIYRDIYADRDKHYEYSYEIEGGSRTYRRRVTDTVYKWKTGYRLEKVC